MAGSQSGARTAASFDLLAIATISVVVGGIVSVPGLVPPFVRIGLGIVFVLFAPGYAFVSLLLPARTTSEYGRPWQLTTVERLLLAVGLSGVIVPLLGYAHHYTAGRIDGTSMVLSVGSVTLVLTALAWGRRRLVTRQFGVDPSGTIDRVRQFLVVPQRRRETVLNAVIVLGIVVAAATIGVTAATNGNGERYTEFYLLSGDPATETAIADGYPVEVASGGSAEVVVGIANHEREPIAYTVVVQLQRIDRTGDDPAVTERVELDTFEVAVESGETEERSHAIEPTLEGESLRVTYLLYTETPPEEPSAENAYRSTHAWIDVTPSVTLS
ncbi:DUF1616 domain-containing protein [Natronomonas sp.]|uniref:DUF1616 domain-containing protein n=1 Tax=Natronomonas sp. TaxID=2184060 RepID=UPI003976BFAF